MASNRGKQLLTLNSMYRKGLISASKYEAAARAIAGPQTPRKTKEVQGPGLKPKPPKVDKISISVRPPWHDIREPGESIADAKARWQADNPWHAKGTLPPAKPKPRPTPIRGKPKTPVNLPGGITKEVYGGVPARAKRPTRPDGFRPPTPKPTAKKKPSVATERTRILKKTRR